MPDVMRPSTTLKKLMLKQLRDSALCFHFDIKAFSFVNEIILTMIPFIKAIKGEKSEGMNIFISTVTAFSIAHRAMQKECVFFF